MMIMITGAVAASVVAEDSRAEAVHPVAVERQFSGLLQVVLCHNL